MAKSIIWKKCPAEIEEEKRKVFGPESNQLDGIISVPYGIHAAQNMEKVVKKIIDFELRPDDIWILTYPKCGTILTQVSTYLDNFLLLFSYFWIYFLFTIL